MEYQIEVAASWGGIERLIAFADDMEGRLQLAHEQGYLLRLVIEEIATNIVKYGYGEHEEGVIVLACSCTNGLLHIAIRDHGCPFDPQDAPVPDMCDDVHSRAVGGLGLFLVREFADQLSYRHDASSGWNELIVTKAHEHYSDV
jgi:anti-sigma regulatory factor (Ser/Thr protein kinase)